MNQSTKGQPSMHKGPSMLRHVTRILYGSESAEFESCYPLNESVLRLDAARGSALVALTRQTAIGTVTESRVVLKRVVPFVGNAFKPYFVGEFEQRHDKVILVGRFTMHWSIKLFMTFWLGFCGLWTLSAVTAIFRHPEQWFVPLTGVGMFAIGVGFASLCQWMSRSDPAWLSTHIRRALSRDAL
jgi:hypothetical protein